MRQGMAGLGSGLLGVVIFSGSLPATRVAVAGFDPVFLTAARAVIAALLAGALVLGLGGPRPARRDLGPLAVVAMGVVVGFPLLTALALQQITSARSIVFLGLLPLATALFGRLRGGERPRPAFWLFSLAGSLAVAVFAGAPGEAATRTGDLLMLAAVLICGLGYAEGATLARRLGAHGLRPDHPGGLGRPRLCLGLQHAGRFRVLVPGPCPRRYRPGRTAAVAAALSGADAGRADTGRDGRAIDAGRDRAGGALRRGGTALRLTGGIAPGPSIGRSG
jgi:hypothetical protein